MDEIKFGSHYMTVGLFAAVTCGLVLMAPVESARTVEMTLLVDMSPEGRKLAHPDRDRPAYYLPVISDSLEFAGSIAGLPSPPPKTEIAREVALALSRQGYLVAHPQLHFNSKREVTYQDGTVVRVPARPRLDRPIIPNQPGDDPLTVDMINSTGGPYSASPSVQASLGRDRSLLAQVFRFVHPVHGPVALGIPSLAIVIGWGTFYPQISDPASGFYSKSPDFTSEIDLAKAVALMTGTDFDRLSTWKQNDVFGLAKWGRYFISIAAYNSDSNRKQSTYGPLWIASMTLPFYTDLKLADAIPLLISAGESRLGRETPVRSGLVDLSKGRVIIGTPEFKDYQTPP